MLGGVLLNIYYELLKYGKVLEKIYLKDYTTIKVGGMARYLFYPTNIKNLQKALKYLKKIKYPSFILGMGSNILATDDFHDLVIIKLDHLSSEFIINNELLKISSNYKLSNATKKLNHLGYGNFLGFSLIPASIGGAIKMNASCYGNTISDTLVKIITINKNGKIKIYHKEDLHFKYRKLLLEEIILYSFFKLYSQSDLNTLEESISIKKKSTQVYDYPSFGSVFKNGEIKSYQLIKDTNMQGVKIGGAMFSLKHANFIVNLGEAKAKDIFTLIKMVQKKVYYQYKVNLNLEVIIL